jgi:very-short-patch-repair endonuclease
MRENPTPAEARFAERLRATGVPFLQQVVIGRYIADFVVPSKMLLYELDGRGHSKPQKILYDQKRSEFLRALGFKVRRIPNRDAGTYPLKRLEHKRQAKKTAFRAARRKAREIVKESRVLDEQSIELGRFDRAHKRLTAEQSSSPPRLIKAKVTLP